MLNFSGILSAGFGGGRAINAKRQVKSARGFTLIELLVVIAIISILATLLLLQLGVARAKARDAKRIADVNQVRSAMELYFDDNGHYLAGNSAASMDSLKPSYLINIPRDPLLTTCTDAYDGTAVSGLNCYGYTWSPALAPTHMQIWSQLEQNNINALHNDADINSVAGGWSGATADGSIETCPNNGTPKNCLFDLGQP